MLAARAAALIGMGQGRVQAPCCDQQGIGRLARQGVAADGQHAGDVGLPAPRWRRCGVVASSGFSAARKSRPRSPASPSIAATRAALSGSNWMVSRRSSRALRAASAGSDRLERGAQGLSAASASASRAMAVERGRPAARVGVGQLELRPAPRSITPRTPELGRRHVAPRRRGAGVAPVDGIGQAVSPSSASRRRGPSDARRQPPVRPGLQAAPAPRGRSRRSAADQPGSTVRREGCLDLLRDSSAMHGLERRAWPARASGRSSSAAGRREGGSCGRSFVKRGGRRAGPPAVGDQ